MSSEASPTAPTERIVSLDILRGIAILGILIINIQAFSMPSIARVNPTEYGDFSGMNFAVWLLGYIFIEQKFVTLFALLFGAGVLLFIQSKESGGQQALRLHYQRTFWLIVIGLIHAYLLWDGDILVIYGLCALWIVLARDWPPMTLAIVGISMMVVPFLIRIDQALQFEPNATLGFWTASEQTIRAEIEAYQSGWAGQMEQRVPSALSMHTTSFVSRLSWRYTGIMLLGMALFKWGVLSNERSITEYRQMIVVSFVGGMGLTGGGVLYMFYHGWTDVAGYVWPAFNYWGSILLAISYVGVVMIFCRVWGEGYVGRGLAAVGRTALSNYLFQTVVAISIFYGSGLGLFGEVTRVEQLLIVIGIWAVQIALSVLWLRRFEYGPVEWLWRTLTYRRFRLR